MQAFEGVVNPVLNRPKPAAKKEEPPKAPPPQASSANGEPAPAAAEQDVDMD